jgi:hypothetical protein
MAQDTHLEDTAPDLASAPLEPVPSAAGGAGSVDKIREILFGSQMLDYDHRFAGFEERLLRETADVRDEIKRRFDTLERFIRQEVDSLIARLGAERDERAGAVNDLTQNLQAVTASLERRSGQLEEQAARGQRELRQQLLDQSQALADQIRQQADQLAALLAREVKSVRESKADRTLLASLLTEVAVRLANDRGLAGDA